MTRVVRLAALFLASPLAAQAPIPSNRGAAGVEVRRLEFGSGIRLSSAEQITFPVVVGVPLTGNWFVDVAGSYARTRLASVEGITVELRGLTDTQLRTAYTLGRDAAVFSVAASFPTGESKASSEQIPIIRSIAQNFVPFPVSNYGTGFGITGGAAVARSFGEWNLGVAASLRYMFSYAPLADLPGDYSPGFEARTRLGVDRLIGGDTRFTGAVTISTFGTDQFTGAGTANFNYRSGKRYIGEVAVSHRLGRSTLQTSWWAFLRTAGDSSGVEIPQAREAVYYGSVVATVPAGRRLRLTPGADLRLWQATDGGRGRAWAARLTVQARLSSRLEFVVSSRREAGRIRLAGQGEAPLQGLAFSAFLRVGTWADR